MTVFFEILVCYFIVFWEDNFTLFFVILQEKLRFLSVYYSNRIITISNYCYVTIEIRRYERHMYTRLGTIVLSKNVENCKLRKQSVANYKAIKIHLMVNNADSYYSRTLYRRLETLMKL